MNTNNDKCRHGLPLSGPCDECDSVECTTARSDTNARKKKSIARKLTAVKSHAKESIAHELTTMKAYAMSAGLYRTARLLEIAIIEVGWEIAGVETPASQVKRQKDTLCL